MRPLGSIKHAYCGELTVGDSHYLFEKRKFASRDDTTELTENSSEVSPGRLQQLSDEVTRIASTLARLAVGADRKADRQLLSARGALDVPVELVRSVIRARQVRRRYFDEELFADPAWDMLLDLFQAELLQCRVSISSLCVAAAVPATTALRWIQSLTDRDLLRRRPDPHDGRRVFIELSPEASKGMRRYFNEVASM